MARPIKETPVLRGSNAVKFLSQINNPSREKVSQEEKERMRRNYEALKNASTF